MELAYVLVLETRFCGFDSHLAHQLSGVCIMPLYNYECPKCNTRFEVVRSIKDHKKSEICPKCGTDSVQLFFPIPWTIHNLPKDRFK